MSLKATTREIFVRHFGYEPTHFVQAPGRVNLLGEHTDYNEGFVLPCAINYQTVIACARNDRHQIRVIAADYQQQEDVFSLHSPILALEKPLWANYVRGVVKHLQMRSGDFGGVDMVISGNIPQGAGLSSSASLEVATGSAISQLYYLPLDATAIALNGQEAENQFVGCQCGIMDQLISAQGQKDHALLIDCRNLATRPVKMPDNVAVMIINSNFHRNLTGSEYNSRRQQCEAGARFFSQTSLRDVDIRQLQAASGQLDPLVEKRVRHILTENARTLAAADALEQNDLKRMGQLMAESHASMRDDFAITVPPIDRLVEIVKAEIGDAGGVRMTGGGFGGCVVALLPDEMIEHIKHAIASQYYSDTGLQETIYICKASAGAGHVEE